MNGDRILPTVKQLMGIDRNYNVFDTDLIVAINSAFMILNQLGVGPDPPYHIEDDTATWEDFSSDVNDLQALKSYIYLRAKILFDPPSSGVLHEAVERQISEFEWRLTVQAEALKKPKGEEGVT